ncbi:M13 family metallopeptidase [Rubrivirga sp. S365]|uniref:M13 family metallopeptidase n=1 Tax=Rubrivirga litoralis TaxID=3075598 RepID=A0ABU3BT14_9BACT|nr:MULTISPECIES: M13 family metallopeptidase [unclassified Rubrivirga]MDT0632425.1 M13 family metallopeptidase [Rubrivirga sp. F394]MDT7855204.1 M13 family metallopeptidase [Rubrivirga sp. S365]
MRTLALSVLAASALVALAAPPAAAQDALGLDTEAMDPEVRPQDDLFRAVNGRWLSTTDIPADKSRYGSFDMLREEAEDNVRAIIEDAASGREVDPDARKIGDFYAAYMDSARVEALGLAPLQPDLDRIEAVNSAEDLARYFAQNRTGFGPSPVAGYVSVDDRDSDRHVFFLTQSGLGLPDKSYYLEDRFADARDAYVDYLARLYELAGWPDGAEAAQTVLDLETELAERQWTRVENRDPEARYNPMSVADLGAAYPNVHFDAMLDEMDVADQIDSLVVRQPSYLAGLDSLMAEVPLEDWTTYARARALSEAAGLLPAAYGEANFNFYGRALSGAEEDRPRWKKAVGATSGALGEAVGRIYVDRHYPQEAADRMEALILNLQEAFRQSINQNPWMTDATKAEALQKLDNYTFKIGYPDVWEDYTALEVSPTDLVGNARAAAEWAYEDNLGKLGEPVDRTEWGMTPQTVNAYYNPAFNEIVFPAAILQPPFFNIEADDAVNYGGIGAVIGHEFSHGFDDQGSQYDAEGNLRNWWSDADRAEFEERADQIVAQYDAYAPFDDANVQGSLTLGENIADLAGLTMAYRAYQISLDEDGDGVVSPSEEAPVIDGYTGDQRFFMGWAQVWRILHREPYLRQLLQVDSHSPGEYRANGPLGNVPAFYDAFDVEPGDALYVAPEDRIVLW